MQPTIVALIVFICTFGGVLVGMKLRTLLPDGHLDAESKDTIKVGIALIATMTALVLGLVTASAKASFDAVDATVKHTAADLLALDRLLARYGPQTAQIRAELKQALAHRIEMTWPASPARQVDLAPPNAGRGAEELAAQIRALVPQNAEQQWLQGRAVDLSESLLTARWMVVAALGTSIPVAFLSIMLFWLTITFTSFGLFAPRNATVVAVMFMCALSVAAALFLVLEMESPFGGFITVSPEPLKYALAHLDRQ